MIKEKKNTITIIYSGVKKEIENVFSLVKSSINGVINIAKKCYDTFIKPWAEPIINFATNYMSFYSMINKGWKIIRNGWGCMKNTFKTGRNYILNEPYEKYWNKTKTYASKSVNPISKTLLNSSIVQTISSTCNNIYQIGKTLYNYCQNTCNLIKNGYDFTKNYIQEKNSTPYLDSLKSDWDSKYNVLSTISDSNTIQNYWNSNFKTILDKGKYIYQKASQYYDEGRNRYKDIKMKIVNYKNAIQNNISDIINSLNKSKEIKSEIKDLKRKKSNEGVNEINERKHIKDIESETKNKSEKMEELREDILTKVNSLKFYFGKFNNLSPKIYNKFQSDINNVEKLINNSNEIEIEKIESIIFNTLKPEFTSLLNENNIKDFIMTL